MLYIGQTYKELNAPTRKYDEFWNIMRYPTKGTKLQAEHHPELAPSRELFNKYRELKEKGLWNEHTFKTLYLPDYIQGIVENPKARESLNYLVRNMNNKDIILLCSCANENTCHRSIVMHMVMGACSPQNDTDKWFYNLYQSHRSSQMFYCIVAGSRTFSDYELLEQKLNIALQNQQNIVIVSGGAKGADALAEQYAKEHGYQLRIFPAHWDKYGKKAGMIRNKEMHSFISRFPNRGCVCFWDGASPGTKNNFDLCAQFNTPLRVVRF